MSSAVEFDYKAVLDNSPSLIFVVNPEFKIVAQHRAHAMATLCTGKTIVGKHLFEAFFENPGHSAAHSALELPASLLRMPKTRQPDKMPIVRYDVQGASGPFHARWIIHRAENVTELVELRNCLAEAFPGKK